MNSNEFFGTLIDRLPASSLLYRCCRRYVNRYDAQNNADMRGNGELRWLREVLPACTTVFDVGANAGEWAAFALQINPKLDIHCFEPSAATFRLLEARKLPGNVSLNRQGLGASRGEAALYVSTEAAGSNSTHRRTGLDVVQTQTRGFRLIRWMRIVSAAR